MSETTYEAQLRQISAFDDLLGYFQGQKPRWDDDVEAAQAAYAALAGNLRGVVGSQMDFTATINPDDPAPTNVRAGVFNTIKAAVDAAPQGSFVTLSLVSGATFPIAADILLANKTVRLIKSGGGANPILTPIAYSTGSHNALRTFDMWSGLLQLQNCDVQFPAKVDAALPWSSTCTLVIYRTGTLVSLGLTGGTVSSSEAEHGLASAKAGTHVTLGIYNTTLDGPFSAVSTAGNGVVEISQGAVTLLNGATLTSAGTIGTNILQN